MTVLKFRVHQTAQERGAKFTIPRWGDAGYDIYASDSVSLLVGEQKLVPTGLMIEIPYEYVGRIEDRSSMANRRIYTHAGTIDPSFRGEVQVMLENRGTTNYLIEAGDRIAQLLILKCASALVPVDTHPDDFTISARGEGAFGSTGK